MDIDPDLLEKYWLGQCSPEEKIVVEEWLNAGEPVREYTLKSDINKAHLENEIWAHISETVRHDATPTSKQEQQFKIKKVFYIAASLLLFTGLSILALRSVKPDLVAIHNIKVPFGKQMTITLPDGTSVTLNSGSEFTYPEKFKNTIRKVMLCGEAYFQVTKNKEKPFIVETPRSITKVLGTKFNLKEFHSDDQTKVTLEEGKVAFSAKTTSRSIILKPGDQAILKDDQIEKRPVNVQYYLNWQKGVLNFQDTPLKDALSEIERYYNVTVTVKDPSVNKLKIRGTFKQVSVSKLFQELSYLLNIKYHIANNHITIY